MILTKKFFVDPTDVNSSQEYRQVQSSKLHRSSNYQSHSPPKPHKHVQASRIIEPLPGPSMVDWKRDSEPRVKSEMQKTSKVSLVNKTFSSSHSGKLDSVKPEISKSEIHRHEPHRKSSLNKKEPEQNIVMDRFGRPMAVRPDTMKVLKQLPDLSFLSARTLLMTPEQKQLVPDLGAMINRKMPG